MSVFTTSCSVIYRSVAQIVVSDDSSTLADQSFSESTYDGLKSFYENDVKLPNIPDANSPDIVEGNGIWKRPGKNDIERINTYENIINDGSNIVIASGYNHQNALQLITNVNDNNYQNKFGNTGFIFVDGAMNTNYKISDTQTITCNPKNVASISNRADNGSFLAGLATSVYLNQNWKSFVDDLSKVPEKISVSSFVGLAIPTTVSLLNGFRLGIMYWNKIANLITIDGNNSGIPIEFISPGNSFNINEFTSGSFLANEQKATTISNSLIAKGVRAIFPIAGPQTKLVVNSITASSKNVAVIGVDSAQENISDLQSFMPHPNGAVQKVIPFSSIKDLKTSVHGVLSAIRSGENKGLTDDEPGYSGFGYNNIADLSNGGVGVSPAGLSYLIDPLFFANIQPDLDNNASTITPTTNDNFQIYDLSTTTSKWSLSKLLETNENDKDKKNIISNYQKLLNNQIKIKYKNESNEIDWTITGNELSSKSDSHCPIFVADKENIINYDINKAFGGTKTKLIANGSLLSGKNWKYSFQID
ncbi:BMP family lipoprotein [Mycoplasmoides pirum]|uniref:BMP family lipoprotein n=1 Tax=Mycoplasmoides pirum TaxID=2122 RepID=UPI00047FC1E8|nr:BMP family ABC transporter substrate-binding protein [Mycoplasmoides pirum]